MPSILAFAFACATENLLPADALDPGPQPACAWTGVEVGLDEDPGAGFTAAQVLAATSGPRSAPLKWDWTGETTVLDSTLAHDGGAVRWMTATVVDSETGEPWSSADDTAADDPETLCPPYLELGVRWSAATADGRLVAEVGGTVAPATAEVLSLVVTEPLLALGGSGLPMEIDPSAWDDVQIEFTVHTSATTGGAVGTGGELAVIANRTTEDEHTSTDEGYVNDVARWPWDG